MTRSVHVPAEIFDSRRYGFAQVAIISTPVGVAVHVSGQVAWDAERNIVGIGDVDRQFRKSLENLAAALASGCQASPTRSFSSRSSPRRSFCRAHLRERCLVAEW